MAGEGNPFYVAPPNILQALMAGQQGYGMAQQATKENDLRQGRLEAVQAFQSGSDVRPALLRLLQAGDTQGANAIANYAQNEVQQRNADRSFGLQEKQLAATTANQAATRDLQRQQFELQKETANRADIKTVKDANGNETLVRVDRNGRPTPLSIGATAPTNPYSAGGKFTEVQGKAATFADRMANSHDIINQNENINKGFSGAVGGVAANSALPLVGGDSALFNASASDERQKMMQAQRDFVNAILRRESGAAISQSEFENAKRQYFPQPGDSDAVLQQKRRNRTLAIEGNMREAGPAYQPPKGWTGRGSQNNSASADVLNQARDAISRGADRNAVIQRLQQNGVDVSGL